MVDGMFIGGARLLRAGLCILLWCVTLSVPAAPTSTATLTLIIDDLGNDLSAGLRALALPGAINYAILPHTPYSRRLAEKGHRMGKTLLLHVPMANLHERPLGPGALVEGQSRQAFLQTLRKGLTSVPHARGVSNHMGSLLTQQTMPMQWLMQELYQQRLFFVDSRTTAQTVAARQAAQQGVPHLSRHVFLDNVRSRQAIDAAFQKLLQRARAQGYAVGIAHPYPETLNYLKFILPSLKAQGFRLASIPEQLLTLNRHFPADAREVAAKPDSAPSPEPSMAAAIKRTPELLQKKRVPRLLQPADTP